MSLAGWFEISLTLALVLAAAYPIGAFTADVFDNRETFLAALLGPVERALYRLAGVDPQVEQKWPEYAISMLVFGGGCLFVLYALLRLQGYLPLNPQGFPGVPPDLAFNIAISFITNANWQAYGGETTLSHLSQMAGLTANNFLDSAAAIAIAVALIRGLTRNESTTIGNFWVDMTRATRPLRRRDDRHRNGSVQRRARVDDSGRRNGRDVQSPSRLHLAGRRRYGPLQSPAARVDSGLPRRADDRADPRISWQEDLNARNAIRSLRAASIARVGARLLGRLCVVEDRARQPWCGRSTWTERNRLRLCIQRRRQWLGVRRTQYEHAMVQRHDRNRDVSRAVRPRAPDSRDRRIARRDEEVQDLGRNPADGRAAVRDLPHRRDGIVTLLQYLPALALGPIAE